ARAPTLLRRWACNSCWRSWSFSALGASTSSPIMGVASGSCGRVGRRRGGLVDGSSVRPGNGIGRRAEASSSEVLAMSAVKARKPGGPGGLRAGRRFEKAEEFGGGQAVFGGVLCQVAGRDWHNTPEEQTVIK